MYAITRSATRERAMSSFTAFGLFESNQDFSSHGEPVDDLEEAQAVMSPVSHRISIGSERDVERKRSRETKHGDALEVADVSDTISGS
jgi:hypothetical protein